MSSGTEFNNNAVDLRRPLDKQTLARLTTMHDGYAWLGVFSAVGTVAAAVTAALVWWSWPMVFAAMFVIATRQQAFFVLAHDAAHYRLFASRSLNDWVGGLLASAVGISMRSYRVIHRLHHNDLYGQSDPDIPLSAGYPRGRMYLLKRLGRDLLGATAPKAYSYFFGAPALNTAANVNRRPEDDTAPQLREAAQVDRRFVIGMQLSMLAAAVLSGYLLEYLVLWVLPAVTLLQAMLRLRAIMEHGAVEDTSTPLFAARTNLGPRWVLWWFFPHHVNYHIEHHLYPAIPHYNLPYAHRALKQMGVLEGAEVSTLPQTLKRIFAPRAAAPVTSAA